MSINKRTIIIIIVITLFAGLSATVLLFLKSSPKNSPNTPQGGGVSDKYHYYFNNQDLAFYRTNSSENQKVFSLSYNPATVTFSANNTKALIIGAKQDISRPIDLVDLNKLQLFTLDPRIINGSLSPDGQNIAYHYYDAEAAVNELRYSDLNHSKVKIIQNLGVTGASEYFDFYSLRFLSNSQLTVFPVYKDITDVALSYVDLASNSSRLLTTGPIIDILPAPDGQKMALILSEAIENSDTQNGLGQINEGLLWFMDLNGNKTPTTIKASANHIAWSADSSKLFVVQEHSSGIKLLIEVYQDGEVNTISNGLQIAGEITQISVSKDGKNLLVVAEGNVRLIELSVTIK